MRLVGVHGALVDFRSDAHVPSEPYAELEAAWDHEDEARFDELLALMRRITALDGIAQAVIEPPADALGEAATLVAAAQRFGQPGPIAQARQVEAALHQGRRGTARVRPDAGWYWFAIGSPLCSWAEIAPPGNGQMFSRLIEIALHARKPSSTRNEGSAKPRRDAVNL